MASRGASNVGRIALALGLAVILSASWGWAAAPKGKPAKPKKQEGAALERIRGKISGKIVWATSRGKRYHDIWIMNADGTEKKQLTNSKNVDWFSRFSPDGKRVLFVRSKRRWEPETNAHRNERWDVFVINADGTGEEKVAENASWSNWRPDGTHIVFARNTKVYKKNLETGKEELLLDSEQHLYSADLQQPEMSPDGNYLAITLRVKKRELGIWDFKAQAWTKTFGASGCQVSWFPSGDRLIWMNQSTGRGGTEVFSAAFKDGGRGILNMKWAQIRLKDLPGRRSHEYFPKVSPDGQFIVWCATARGHDHDFYDYEVFINKIDAPVKQAVRLTFHTGNDRWPHMHAPMNGAAGGQK